MSDTKTILEIEQDIVEEFSLFDSWEDKYEYIIDMGKKLKPLDDIYKKGAFAVKNVSGISSMNDGLHYTVSDKGREIVKYAYKTGERVEVIFSFEHSSQNYFSMFSGIGGFDLALNRQGHECVGYSEINKYAIQIYQQHFGLMLKHYLVYLNFDFLQMSL
jgi:hypothetical protein